MIPSIKYTHFNVAITEMNPSIPWELAVDPKGSAERTVGTASLQ
jgi:hypothetical protein